MWFDFTEVPPDADGLYGGMISPPEQARYIRTLAWLSFVSGLVALGRGHYDITPVPFGVWATSMLYWTKPTYSWRRWVDIVYVVSACLYQHYRASSASNRAAYYVFISCAWICYPIGHYFHSRGETWLGCIWHGYIHIFASIGNIVLYLGEL